MREMVMYIIAFTSNQRPRDHDMIISIHRGDDTGPSPTLPSQ